MILGLCQPVPKLSAARYLTVKDIFEQMYLPNRPNLKKSTIESHRSQVKLWVSLMGDLPAHEIDRETLLRFRDQCRARDFCGSTTNKNLTTILKLIRSVGIAIGDGEILADWDGRPRTLTLCDLTRIWNVVDRARWPSAAEYRSLRTDAIQGSWWRALLMLAYTTGLRRSDLFDLRWDQVDALWIRAAFQKGARPKLLPITEALRPWLQLLRMNEKETVLGRSDGNALDQEIARLRELSGVAQFSLNAVRYLSGDEWDKAGKGCGSLIRNHKRGTRVSDWNYRKLSNAAGSLEYPADLLVPPGVWPFAKALTPCTEPTKSGDGNLPAASGGSSLSLFQNCFSSPAGRAQRVDSMTLRDVFETSLRELLESDDRAKGTIDGYELALRYWERLTDNPPIREITTDYLRGFRKAAKADTQIKPVTINGRFRNLRAILNHLGPRNNSSRRSRSALAFHSEVPWLDDLPQPEPNPVHLDDDQLNNIYEHCEIAEWPLKSRTNCEPADWWRCALVIMVNYGPRLQDWYRLPSKAVSFDRGMCTFTAKKTGKKHHLILNDTVTWHLKRLSFGEREFVFTPTRSNRQIYREWQRIQASAGVQDPEGLPFTFHAVRATAAARYHEYFPGTAELLLGHGLPRESRVTERNYIGNVRLLAPLWHAIRNIPQPLAFTRAVQTVVESTERIDCVRCADAGISQEMDSTFNN